MFSTLVSVVGRALSLWRAERLLHGEELRQYTALLGVQASISLNDHGEPVVRIVPDGGVPIEVEIEALVFQPAYTVYAVTESGYRHILWCSYSAEGAAAAAAGALGMVVHRRLVPVE